MNSHFYLFATTWYTILVKEVRRLLRLWVQTLLPPVINTGLYFLIFGEFLGQRIGGLHGFTFSQFIAPGLIMLAVINNSFQNVVGTFYTARFTRAIEELLVSPAPEWLILLGYLSSGVIRGWWCSLLVLLVSVPFTTLPIAHLALAIFTIFIAALLFSSLGFTNGLFARNFDDISIVSTFLIVPLTYLGGIFYDVHALQHPWDFIATFNPIYYLLQLLRYAILGYADPSFSPLHGIIGICAIMTLSIIVNLILLRRGYGIRT